MDLNATIDIIIKDLNEAREIIDDLKKYPGVPALQIELAKSKCKSAGDVIALLKNIPPDTVIDPVITGSRDDSKEKLELLSDNIREMPQAETNKHLTDTGQVKERVIEKNQEVKHPGKKIAESTIIADRYSHLSSRFNQQLSSLKEEDEVPDVLKTKPLASLSDAIGINDKFLFIREIFNGNKEEYVQIIAKLENISNLSEARTLLMSCKGDDDENEAVRQLLDLVKRKLP